MPSPSPWPTARRRGWALLDSAGVGRSTLYHPFHAARADLLRRVGAVRDDAAAAYRRALELATNAAERRFLAARLAECER